jgi:hypothetical protein
MVRGLNALAVTLSTPLGGAGDSVRESVRAGDPAGERYSHGLRRLAAVESVRGSFDQAAAAIDRSNGLRVGKRQVQRLAQAAAVNVAGFYAGRRPGPGHEGDLLVLTYDGKGIVMVPCALRKAAAAGGHKLSTRLSPGGKRGRKRMAELACVNDATPVPRRP